MRTLKLAISIILIFLLTGCEKAADVSSPLNYDKHDIRFSYPANWRVGEDVEQGNFRYIIVETPGDALFMVQVFSDQDPIPLDELAENFSARAKEATPIGDVSESTYSDIEKSIGSDTLEGIKEEFSITVLDEEVPHIREYYFLDADGKCVYLICQVATEDLPKVEPGFNLILGSFAVE